MNTTLPDYTEQMTDSELEHYLCELARIESELSADNDAYAYGSN